MDSSVGIVAKTIRPIPDGGHHDNSPNAYGNDGFSSDGDVIKTHAGNYSNKNVTSLNNAHNARDAEEKSPAYYDAAKTEDVEVGFNLNGKKDGGGVANVDFTVPSKGQDRSKSIISNDGPYRGMGKEELLRYSSRPLWRNLRYACMSIVLTGWLALLITVVALVLTYPRCRAAEGKDWWQKTNIYRVYVRSYLDSNSDGIGDINGLMQRLDYLKDSGVGTLSLSPIYKLSSNATDDSHIVDHTEVDPVFGTLDDFKALVNKTHDMGMYLILDFIPNHTSDEHPWFLKSKAEADQWKNPYRSYYVWEQGKDPNGLQPPNTWQSVYNCSAWSFTSEKNSHYLHQFLPSQPDLNLRSQKVRRELENVLQFWLDLGVDGFYIRDADFLFEDYDLRDNVLEDNSTTIECDGRSTPPYEAYATNRTRGLSEVFDVLARWRSFLDHFGNKTNSYKILLADVDAPLDHVMRYYGIFNRDGVDMPLNKLSLDMKADNGRSMASMVNSWLSQMPAGRWANWMGGDDRSDRLNDRLGPAAAMPFLMLTFLLPGTPYLYYGDEIGMRQNNVSGGLDRGSRVKAMRGPMLWNNKTHAGFCSQYCATPWMAPYSGYLATNVEAQRRDPFSMWNLFRNLTTLRKDYPSFEYGDYVLSIQDDQVFSFVREFDGEKGFLVALNFANTKVARSFTGTHETIPESGNIEIVSGNTGRRQGNGIDLDPLTLEPYQGVVVSWDYKAKDI